ncbi:alpha/beta hydrolase [Actinomadura opuntiae]|uniref:alpha/beta hydrolase n=1 Tax=Actinomadura sp. OS1-43 TaxID=604315 RepID=UPI00255B3626|nr:alpha/beta hydrolase [Actinomadura sp. OS1-43]MDL4813341.1 alpha/beta hydrolase [Actinomadura sp. OS1-43]
MSLLRPGGRLGRLSVAGAALALVPAAVAPAAAASTTASTATPSAPADGTTSHSGKLADGATWTAEVPARWNGTLLLFSHGFGPLVAQDAPRPGARTALLAEGYALAGSSYDPNGSMWALKSAERDQFATIDAFRAAAGRPRQVISVGQSMGGLINAQIARDGAGRVDGALGLCGLVAGGVDLDNYQLDAEYAISALLDPGDRNKLVGFSDTAEAAALGAKLTDAVTKAQATPQGRARIALAAAYLNLADWAPDQQPPARNDYAGQEKQQYAWFAQGLLSFLTTARYQVELSAGGNTSWNRGVDYAALLRRSSHAKQVGALYRSAGLNLGTDLARLTKGADVTADPVAVRSLRRTSTAGQGLGVPLLDVHTTSDQLVPVEQESAFAARVRASGDGALLRQAYVARQSHCNFTTAETVAAVHAVQRRADTGRWTGTSAAGLQRSALALGLDGAAFVRYRPGVLVGARR